MIEYSTEKICLLTSSPFSPLVSEQIFQVEYSNFSPGKNACRGKLNWVDIEK